MLKPKKKITKRELKEDKLVTWYFKISDAISKYQKQIVTGSLIFLGAILLLYFIIIKPRQENKEIASTALANVMGFYDYRQYQIAINGVPERNVIGLKQIADEFGSTDAGEVAKIYLANSYFAMGDFDNALKYYEDFSGSNKMFKASALAGVAAVYEEKKQYADAAKYFEKAAELTSDELQTPENLFLAARNFNQAGNKQKAVELLEKIKFSYPKSYLMKDIDRYIAEYQG